MNGWGYVDQTRWALVKIAPLTASGLNEITARAQYRSAIMTHVKAIGINLKRDGYEIHDLQKVPKK